MIDSGLLFVTIWSDLLIDLSLFRGPFLNRFSRLNFLKFTTDRQGSDNKSAKLCQDLPRSAKIKRNQPNDRQAQTAKRNMPKRITKRRAQELRGRRCHAAWRLQSASGPNTPRACLRLDE